MRRTSANKFAYLFGRMLGGIRRSEAQADGFLSMDLVFIFPHPPSVDATQDDKSG